MPPTFLIFALFVAAAFVSPVVLVAVLVLVANARTRPLGRKMLVWGMGTAGTGFVLACFVGHLRASVQEVAGGAGGGFTCGAALGALLWLIDGRPGRPGGHRS
jgi:hypothetical protein